MGLFSSTAMAGNALWVTADNATLKASRSASASTVATLPVGMQLTQLDYQSRWYQVRAASGQTGWIYRGKVSSQPPAGQAASTDGVGNLLAGLSGSSIQADAADTSRSIRGLSPAAQAYARQNGSAAVYQQALDQVLKRHVDNPQIDQFLKSGQIGEYAR